MSETSMETERHAKQTNIRYAFRGYYKYGGTLGAGLSMIVARFAGDKGINCLLIGVICALVAIAWSIPDTTT